MTDHWLEAEVARQLIMQATGRGDWAGVAQAICARANEGLVAAQARLYIEGDRRLEQAVVPAGFWWARGLEALEQDWSVGDFATWIDQRVECRAFGVRFRADDIFDMLPADARSKATLSLSIAGDREWMPASRARGDVWRLANLDAVSAGQLIIDRSRIGLIGCRALLVETATAVNSEIWKEQGREWEIPAGFWSTLFGSGSVWLNWDRGLFHGQFEVAPQRQWTRITGVHFRKSDIEAIYAAAADLPNTAVTLGMDTGKTGRPPAPFWDALMCSIWGDIYRGDLKPKRLAEIERAMLDWAAANDYQAGESAVRQRARLVLAELEREVEK